MTPASIACPPGDVTRLLLDWSAGSPDALERVLPLVYSELRRRAGGQMRRERGEHTLQPTALVHEAYLKLVDQSGIPWRDRAHFFAVAARAMRQVLVDHARRRGAAKNGGGEMRVPLGDVGGHEAATAPRSLDLVALDHALERLAALDDRQGRIVELRVFGGLTVEETAEALGCSHATVSRDYRAAEAWLRRELAPGAGDGFLAGVSSELARMGDTALPTSIGLYRPIREIATGGMGTVYLAERADGRGDGLVAVKVVSHGMDTDAFARRFRSERRILAGLSHPNIARLLDGGATPDGRPFLVMEHVSGVDLESHARAAGLGVKERIALFRLVCDAVAHAHRHLVVHGDLKPGNVLVTEEGTPKLLDFGLARLVQSAAGASGDAIATGFPRMLTPDFASPEQLRGEPLTTASDVYSLGVVLHRLLTGRLPPAVAEPGRQPAPTAQADGPGSGPSGLGAELDAVLRKALEPEVARRHGSAGALSEDLERWEASADATSSAARPRPASRG